MPNDKESQVKAILHWWNHLQPAERIFISAEMCKDGPFYASTNDIVKAINKCIWSEVPGYPN